MLNGWGKPAEKEWEWASQAGLKNKEYPWANQVPSSSRDSYGRNVGKPTAVGSYPANGYGLYDMAGNVAEWCQDWYQHDYYNVSPDENPKGPKRGERKVTRGGHWYSWHKGLRVYNRGDNPPDVRWWQDVQGFRCVSDLK